MIVSQPRDTTLCLHPAQLRSIRIAGDPDFLHPLLLVGSIRLWPLRAQGIPVAVMLGWRCHLLFQACEARTHLACRVLIQ